jgi:hypothetical protein
MRRSEKTPVTVIATGFEASPHQRKDLKKDRVKFILNDEIPKETTHKPEPEQGNGDEESTIMKPKEPEHEGLQQILSSSISSTIT